MPTKTGIHRSTLGSNDINAGDTGCEYAIAKSFTALATGGSDALFCGTVCANGFCRLHDGAERLFSGYCGVDVADGVPVASRRLAVPFDGAGIFIPSLPASSKGI